MASDDEIEALSRELLEAARQIAHLLPGDPEAARRILRIAYLLRLFDEVALAPSALLRRAAMKRAQWEIDCLAELGDPVLLPDQPPDNAPRH
jgi:hypothetical protein